MSPSTISDKLPNIGIRHRHPSMSAVPEVSVYSSQTMAGILIGEAGRAPR